MSKTNLRTIKYVFIEVVADSKRTIESQSDITKTLNKIVKSTIYRYKIGDDSVIYIPSGDGICIALTDTTLPYDIHVTIALDILRRIGVYNKSKDDRRKFEVRIGINQSDDILLEDINGRKNVAGAGLSSTRRIMDLADASQILVSHSVYENLHQREKYLDAFTKFKAPVQHDIVLEVYQLTGGNIAGLNVNPPSSLTTAPEPEPKLTKLSAYYLAHAMKNKKFILEKTRESPYNNDWMKLLLWFLARNSEKVSNATLTDIKDIDTLRVMPDTGCDTIEEHYEWFHEHIPLEIAMELRYVVSDNAVPLPFGYDCFERYGDSLIVSSEGGEMLKRDWPEIWDEFGLGELK